MLTFLRLVPLVLDVVLHAASCALFFFDGLLSGILAWLAPICGLVELVAYVVLGST